MTFYVPKQTDVDTYKMVEEDFSGRDLLDLVYDFLSKEEIVEFIKKNKSIDKYSLLDLLYENEYLEDLVEFYETEIQEWLE